METITGLDSMPGQSHQQPPSTSLQPKAIVIELLSIAALCDLPFLQLNKNEERMAESYPVSSPHANGHFLGKLSVLP